MGMAIALLLHLLSVTVWVGGMFFTYIVLRPAAASMLEPPQRLTIWKDVFARFFPWVWVSVVLILSGGLHMWMLLGGTNAPLYIHVMLALGLLMMAIFAYVFFSPYRRLQQCVNAADWPAGGVVLAQIRKLVGFNLILGIVTICVAVLGRWM